MSIEVNKLNKVYGVQKAVDDVSFFIKSGGIVGFLGPNGAGKSTTMKMLTGYLAPSGGEIKINGVSFGVNSLEQKKRIGYLPENNPLYTEMYVVEYLNFVGSLYGIKDLKKRVAEVISLVGLDLEKGKKIEQLSKGYKQRVGLAQALIHNPDILILDEPTTGLDPNQLVEIRKLIKQISENKTIILSTHIMQEVEAVCDRVLIINKGKLVVDSSLVHLREKGQSLEDVFRKLTQ